MSAVETQEKEEAKILIGTSGFSYKDWMGHFYPEPISDRDMLRHYAQSFDTVEKNSSYYAIPQAKHMEAMFNKTEGNLEL